MDTQFLTQVTMFSGLEQAALAGQVVAATPAVAWARARPGP